MSRGHNTGNFEEKDVTNTQQKIYRLNWHTMTFHTVMSIKSRFYIVKAGDVFVENGWIIFILESLKVLVKNSNIIEIWMMIEFFKYLDEFLRFRVKIEVNCLIFDCCLFCSSIYCSSQVKFLFILLWSVLFLLCSVICCCFLL